MATFDHRDRVGSERHLHHHHSVPATVVMQEPHVDGLLGNRAASFQKPLPRLFWLHPAILDACISTRRGRAQGTDRPRSSYGTFMAHKSEKPWSAGSASVKQPSTKRRIVSVPCGFRSHS